MKIHLQKTRIVNGRKEFYKIPECGKRGSSNAFLKLASFQFFENLSEEEKKLCCVNCLAAFNQKNK